MGRTKNRGQCAYCPDLAITVDHVVPSSLYPASLGNSRFQRITVPSCQACNNKWSRDEDHFRAMMLLAGQTNHLVQELWEGPTLRSMQTVGGMGRARALFDQMVPAQIGGKDRHMIFPARDTRVMGIIRKIVRGLSHHHKLLSPVSDEQVWANVLVYDVPPELREKMPTLHAEPEVLKYQFGPADDAPGMHTAWLLKFFERTEFIAIVYDRSTARQIAE